MGTYEYVVVVPAGSADLDGDGDVDPADFALFVQSSTLLIRAAELRYEQASRTRLLGASLYKQIRIPVTRIAEPAWTERLPPVQ
jgi:hypothetical protein